MCFGLHDVCHLCHVSVKWNAFIKTNSVLFQFFSCLHAHTLAWLVKHLLYKHQELQQPKYEGEIKWILIVNNKYALKKKKVVQKHFVQVVKQEWTFAPLLFGPADFGDVIMLCQVVQVTVKILVNNNNIMSQTVSIKKYAILILSFT